LRKEKRDWFQTELSRKTGNKGILFRTSGGTGGKQKGTLEGAAAYKGKKKKTSY